MCYICSVYNAANYSFANSFNKNERTAFPQVSSEQKCLKVLHFFTILTLKVRLQLEELLNYDPRLNRKSFSEWMKY